MLPAKQAARWTLVVALGVFGALIAARTLIGPFSVPFPVRSPINVESFFGLAFLLLVLVQTTRSQSVQRVLRPLGGFDGLAVVGIVLIIVAAYWRAAGFYFLSDDFIIIRSSLSWPALRTVFTIGGGDGFYRPLGHVSNALTAAWAAANPAYWHAAEIALHAVNSTLIFQLAWTLGLSRPAALFAAALFAVHGSRPEPVIWIAARFDLLATMFVLLGLVAFIRSWDASGGAAVVYRAIAWLAMSCGFLSKETAYTFPLLLVVFLASRGALWTKRAWYALAPFVAAAIALLLWRWRLFGGIGGYLNQAGEPAALSLSFVPALKALALRLWAVLFFPINWDISPGPLLGLLMIIYVAALIWLARAQVPWRGVVVSLGFLLLMSLPALQQLLIGADLQKARHLYLPSAAFCLLLAQMIESLRGRLLWGIAAAIAAFHAVALFHNLTAWEYASTKAKSACSVAARCANAHGGNIVVSGLPNDLNGVYFFANGFRECVERARGGEQAAIDSRSNDAVLRHDPDSCILRWDSGKDELIPQ